MKKEITKYIVLIILSIALGIGFQALIVKFLAYCFGFAFAWKWVFLLILIEYFITAIIKLCKN